MKSGSFVFVGVATLALVGTGIRHGAFAAEPTAYLAKDGATAYCIVLSPSAGPSEKTAAEELRAHFKACTGADLAIASDVPSAGTPMLVLGCGPAARSLGVDPKPEDLGEQGYVIRTVTPHLVIAGTPAAGTLCGVYDFIERHLGVRWYAPGVTKTPSVAALSLPEENRSVRPGFAWRHTSYAWPGGDDAFRARARENSGRGGPDNPYGVQYGFDGSAHSYFWYVSPGEFFATHPEYFSEIGGARQEFETQLCLTNPDVLDIVTERMLARMAEKPGMRQHNFSQMDYYNCCECERCNAVNKQYEIQGGAQFWFVNQLAKRTSKVYPDKLISTLAYMYTEEPPKGLVMHPNVAVWLCHMYPSCDSHAIATCPLNGEHKRRAIAWSRICSHVYMWHYIVDFAHYYNPFPNFRALAADLRFYHDIGVEGVYLQGMSAEGGGGEFSLLRPYYAMKMAWDPAQDAETVLRDFVEGYYGPASEPIWNYIALLNDKVESENIHMHLYTNPAQGYLTDDVLVRAMDLFDQAEQAVAQDEELLERVRVARMPLTYARLFPRNGYVIDAGKLTFQGPFPQMPEVRDFLQRMERHGFSTLREMFGEPQQLLLYAQVLPMPMDLATLHSTHLTVETAPFLGGRALRIIDNATGRA